MNQSATLTVDYALLQKKGDDSLESKLDSLASSCIQRLRIVSLFVTNGFECKAMKARVRAFSSRFKKISFTKPVLSGKTRIYAFAKQLISHSYFDPKEKTILVGHGLPYSKNSEYRSLERKLHKLGAKNVRLVLLKGQGSVQDFLSDLEKSGGRKNWLQVCVVPLFINCGRHVKSDIFGAADSEPTSHKKSLCQILEENGITVEKSITSLGEQAWFKDFVNE